MELKGATVPSSCNASFLTQVSLPRKFVFRQVGSGLQRSATLNSSRHRKNSALSYSGSSRRLRSQHIICSAGDDFVVAITGATGLVGSRLAHKLTTQGAVVRVLTRDVNRAKSILPYARIQFFSPAEWAAAIRGCTGVVNLAGEPIGTTWTERIKREIKDSRVGTTKKIVAAINACPEAERPKVLVSTSAVGFYGTSDTASFAESSSAGSDYLAEVCQQWEAAANEAQVDRVVIIRTGIVLAKEGGALGKMLPMFQIFVGGPLGSGQQWCSWIHRDDLVALYIEALKNPMLKGVYNGTAPNPVRMSELCASLGRALGRPSWLPVPSFALQGMLGDGATVVLDGQRVLPQRLHDVQFEFKYSRLDGAIANLLRRR
eukprot:jgi/Botrbrau1/11009/Bobra.101_1s0007.1